MSHKYITHKYLAPVTTAILLTVSPVVWSDTSADWKKTVDSINDQTASLFNKEKLKTSIHDIDSSINSVVEDTAMKLKYEIYKSKLPKDMQEKLAIAQKSWLSYRAASVGFIKDLKSDTGEQSAKGVYTDMTKDHTALLERLIKELPPKS